MEVELLVEGYTDEIFVRRCFDSLGILVGTVYGKQGIFYVIEKAEAFSVRGDYSPILILADFADMKIDCVVDARNKLSTKIPEQASVRLAIMEIESWLIASRQELARYLGVSIGKISSNPDIIADPKQALINLARESRYPRIRKMFVPRHGVSSVVGPGYVDGFTEFMSIHWNIDEAMKYSPSFVRFVTRMREKYCTKLVE